MTLESFADASCFARQYSLHSPPILPPSLPLQPVYFSGGVDLWTAVESEKKIDHPARKNEICREISQSLLPKTVLVFGGKCKISLELYSHTVCIFQISSATIGQ